jgi:hypothetical protein
MLPAVSDQPRAGWYPDPAGTQLLRYWDGAQWTESVQSYPTRIATEPAPAPPAEPEPAPTPAPAPPSRDELAPVPRDVPGIGWPADPAIERPPTRPSTAPSTGSHPALGPPPHGTSPRRGSTRRRVIVAAAIVAVILVVVGIAAATTGGDDDSPNGDASPTTTTPTTAATSAVPATAATDEPTTTTATTSTTAATVPAAPAPPYPAGALQVGVDIPPGRYEADGGPDCYWERMRGSDGSERITNRLGGGHVTVQIADSDTVFRSDQCGTWNPAGPFLVAQTEFDDGIWSVNAQIAPGRYRNSGGTDCYWARLRGFGGEGPDIIANAQPTRAVIVEIQAGDLGFESRGCGHWSPA